METIIIENRDEEKSITHPQYGPFRYYEIAGELWLMRRDVSIGFGLSGSSSCSAFITDKYSKVAIRKFVKSANMTTVIINKDGLKEFMQYGVKNRARRQLVGHWLLKELYGEQIDEPQEDLFKAAPAPLTLSPAQMNELVRRVTDLLRFEPLKIALSDGAKEEIVNNVCEQQKKNPPPMSGNDLILITKNVTKLFKDQFLKWADQRKAEIVNEAVEDATKLLQAKPIALSEKQMDDIAYKVLALIGDVQPNEDAIVNRVVDKLNARMRITL